MELLRSSIIGKEFVNYRRSTMKETRLKFSDNVRKSGLGNIPVVIDSVDKELSNLLKIKHSVSSEKYLTYGRELVFKMDERIEDVLRHVKIIMLEKKKEDLVVTESLVIGLENGTIPDLKTELGKLYKTHRNTDDKILYLMISKETTVYGYIISILRYLKDNLGKIFNGSKN